MKTILTILKQRRFWAMICALISILLRAYAPDIDFDSEKALDTITATIQAISDLGMVFLPLWSLVKPKK